MEEREGEKNSTNFNQVVLSLLLEIAYRACAKYTYM